MVEVTTVVVNIRVEVVVAVVVIMDLLNTTNPAERRFHPHFVQMGLPWDMIIGTYYEMQYRK